MKNWEEGHFFHFQWGAEQIEMIYSQFGGNSENQKSNKPWYSIDCSSITWLPSLFPRIGDLHSCKSFHADMNTSALALSIQDQINLFLPISPSPCFSLFHSRLLSGRDLKLLLNCRPKMLPNCYIPDNVSLGFIFECTTSVCSYIIAA